MRRHVRSDTYNVGKYRGFNVIDIQPMSIGELVERFESKQYWGLWHRGLVGRPWRPFDHALDVYGTFPDFAHDDYSEDSDANAVTPWQPIRERI
jgi:hypothetical protein